MRVKGTLLLIVPGPPPPPILNPILNEFKIANFTKALDLVP